MSEVEVERQLYDRHLLVELDVDQVRLPAVYVHATQRTMPCQNVTQGRHKTTREKRDANNRRERRDNGLSWSFAAEQYTPEGMMSYIQQRGR